VYKSSNHRYAITNTAFGMDGSAIEMMDKTPVQNLLLTAD